MWIILTVFFALSQIEAGSSEVHPRQQQRAAVSNAEIQEVMQQLWQLDANRLQVDVDYQLDYQGAASPNSVSDHATNKLFKFVKAEVLQTPTIEALMAMYDDFTPDSYQTEKQPASFAAHRDAFLDAVFQTAVFQQAYTFLVDKGLASSDLNKFRADLSTYWFGLYARHSNGPVGSSGFEHIYIGEYNKNDVDGLHSWIRYYTLESHGDINYYGHFVTDSGLGMELQFKWGQYTKKLGGFFIGTSPEFDFSVLTVCYLAKQGSDACRFQLDGKNIAVTSYNQGSNGGHNFIASAYPDFG